MKTVISKDGTKIAYEKVGSGPAVVLVDGAGSYRKFGTSLFLPPELSKHFTVYTYDRRGRGDSGDTPPYAIEREIEDLQAVLDEVGGAPYLYGHSSGASLAMYAVANGLKPAKLVLYEPPYVVVNSNDEKPPTDAMQQLKTRLQEGHPSAAMTYWLTKIVGIPGFVVNIILKIFMHKYWKYLVAAAHTLPYDLEIVEKSHWMVPKDIAAKIKIPCLVMGGKKSPEKLRNAVSAVGTAIPGAEIKFLDGVDHNASPKKVVPELVKYFK